MVGSRQGLANLAALLAVALAGILAPHQAGSRPVGIGSGESRGKAYGASRGPGLAGGASLGMDVQEGQVASRRWRRGMLPLMLRGGGSGGGEPETPIGRKRSRRQQGISPELKNVSPSLLSARKKKRVPGGGVGEEGQVVVEVRKDDDDDGITRVDLSRASADGIGNNDGGDDDGAFVLPPKGLGTAKRLFGEMESGNLSPTGKPVVDIQTSPAKASTKTSPAKASTKTSPAKASTKTSPAKAWTKSRASPSSGRRVKFDLDKDGRGKKGGAKGVVASGAAKGKEARDKMDGEKEEEEEEEEKISGPTPPGQLSKGMSIELDKRVKEGLISRKQADALLEEEAAMRTDPVGFLKLNKDLMEDEAGRLDDAADGVDSSDIPFMSDEGGEGMQVVQGEGEDQSMASSGEEEGEEDVQDDIDDDDDDDDDGEQVMGPWLVRFPSIGELSWVALKAQGEIHDDNLEDIPVQVVFLPPVFGRETKGGGGGKEACGIQGQEQKEEEGEEDGEGERHALVEELCRGMWHGSMHQERLGGKLIAKLKGKGLKTSEGSISLTVEWGEGSPTLSGRLGGKTRFEEVMEERVLEGAGRRPSVQEVVMFAPVAEPADDDVGAGVSHAGGAVEGVEGGADGLSSFGDGVNVDEEDDGAVVGDGGEERGTGRVPKTNLVVIGLDKETSKGDLREAFKECGSIQYIRMIRRKGNKESLAFSGTAVVEFFEEAGMRKGLALGSSGLMVRGKPVTCKVGKPVAPPVRGSDEGESGCTVYVKGLPFTAREADLRLSFGDVAPVVSLRMPKSKKGTFAGYCFVEYKTSRAAAEAIRRFSGKEWKGAQGPGRKISVQVCKKEGGADLNKRFVWASHSGNVFLNKVQTSAMRSSKADCFTGYVIGSSAIQGRRWWELQVLKTSKRNFNGGIEVGVTTHASHTNNASTSLPASGTWLIRDTHPHDSDHPLHLYPGGATFGMATLNAMDEIRLMYDRGTLSVLVNGRKQGVAFTGLPDRVYPCVNLFGRCTGVRIVGQGAL